MNRLVASITLFVLAVQVSATRYIDCGSTRGQVTGVRVTDCPDTADTCILRKGTTMGITIDFRSKVLSNTARAEVHEIIGDLPLPFYLREPDGCKSGIDCPIYRGKNYNYTSHLPIIRSYRALPVTVKWEIRDDMNNDLVCVEIPCWIR